MTVTIAPLRDYEYHLVFGARVALPILATSGAPGALFRTGTETPEKLSERISDSVPFVRFTQTPGRTTRTHVYPGLDVDVFSKSRHLSRQLAADIEAWLTRGMLRLTATIGGVESTVMIDRVATTSSPQRVPWPDATVDRYLASYQIETRRV